MLANAMTVDVEDYFQVGAFTGSVRRADWDSFPSRVEANTDRILGRLAEARTVGTFFTLGWVAERFPALVRRIVAQGHELASHGWDHTRADAQAPDVFRNDVRRARHTLEQVGGVPVVGYRAATFSIGARNLWAFGVLASEGYRYSSSIYPVKHDTYGMPHAPRMPFQPDNNGFWELPMTTVAVGGRNLPCSGGGYFRLVPYPVFRLGLRRFNAQTGAPGIFYTHPWEVDPGQPRIAAPRLSRFRHYVNLHRTDGRLRRLLADFRWDRIDRIHADKLAAPPALAAA